MALYMDSPSYAPTQTVHYLLMSMLPQRCPMPAGHTIDTVLWQLDTNAAGIQQAYVVSFQRRPGGRGAHKRFNTKLLPLLAR